MNIVGFDKKNLSKEALGLILNGGNEKIKECGGVLLGGHTIESPEMYYGLSVTGMIHPNMATMLAYIFTDVSLSPEKAQFYLGKAVNLSFNRISVDGDCSTNDTVFLMANGAAGVKISSTKDEEVFFSIAGRCLSGLGTKNCD
jgi:hypothetical protein